MPAVAGADRRTIARGGTRIHESIVGAGTGAGADGDGEKGIGSRSGVRGASEELLSLSSETAAGTLAPSCYLFINQPMFGTRGGPRTSFSGLLPMNRQENPIVLPIPLRRAHRVSDIHALVA